MITWMSSLIHANTCPTTDAIKNRLRRLTAFVSFLPIKTKNKEWMAKRRLACQNAFTAGHDPSNPDENNRSVYPRHKSFKAVSTPRSCSKVTFTPEQLALL